MERNLRPHRGVCIAAGMDITFPKAGPNILETKRFVTTIATPACSEHMIRVSVSSGHPVTIMAAGPVHYYFGRLISATENAIRLHLRRAVRDAHAIDTRSVIIETVGGVTVEVDCRNITLPGSSVLTLEILEPPSLEIRVATRGC